MPVQVNQKFPKCALCGKMIPLRTEPITLQVERKKLSFCSDECFQMYQERQEAAPRRETWATG